MYLIDGDFDILDFSPALEKRGLYVLPRYCIENFLADMNAIEELIFEEDVERPIDEIRDALDLQRWSDRVAPHLLRLFAAFAAARGLAIGVPLVGSGYTRFILDKNGEISLEKIDSYIEHIRESMSEAVTESFDRRFKEFIRRTSVVDKAMYRVVSGKDFLMPLLLVRGRSFVRMQSPNNKLLQRLAMKAQVDELRGLEDKIIDD